MKKRVTRVTRDSRVLIVAGNRDQAELWARAEHLPQAAWTYALDAQSLRGWTPSRIIRCGNYWERSDWDQLAEELDVIEARMQRSYEQAGFTTMETLFLILIVGTLVYVAVPILDQSAACAGGHESEPCVEFHARYGPGRSVR